MASERYEIRLDPEHKHKLRELATAYGVPGSKVLKDMIDEAYEATARERRLAAARRIGALETEVPDLKTLKRLIEEAHEPRIP